MQSDRNFFLSCEEKSAGITPFAQKLATSANQGIAFKAKSFSSGKLSLIISCLSLELATILDKWSATTFSIPFFISNLYVELL